MSETVHYRGVATKIEQPNDKTLIEVAESILKERNIELDEYYEGNSIKQLCEDMHYEFFYYPGTNSLYSITRECVDQYDDIIQAELKDNGTIEYDLKYYNGGAGFEECLEEAFDKLK
jgi:hypothetical protein